MRKRLLYTAAVLFTGLLFGCSGSVKPSANYMVLDDVRYITEFPQTFSLDNSVMVETDVIGINSLNICDSLLIFSTRDPDGFWSILSLPNLCFLGKFITKGQGPNEFAASWDVDFQRFASENGNYVAYIRDGSNQRIYKMNIDESVKNKRLSMRQLNVEPYRGLSLFVLIDSVSFIGGEFNKPPQLFETEPATQQSRYLYENGKKTVIPAMEKLNLAKLKETDEFGGTYLAIITADTKINYEKNIVVEKPYHLNYLNIYSLDGSLAKTICIGDKPVSIESVQSEQFEERPCFFGITRLFSEFWSVIYAPKFAKTKPEVQNLPSIYLFDWKANPLAELKMDKDIWSFDIDFNNGTLYALAGDDDEVYKYDIKDILKKLKIQY